MTNARIGKGHVFHSRKTGEGRPFRYPTFFVFFRCDKEKELQDLFRNRFRRTLSISGESYLKGESGSLDSVSKSFLRAFCSYEAEEVWLHTLPRMFGYAFNPVSFWVCRRSGKVEAVLVEVRNTFGERHFYWIHPKHEITSEHWFQAEKVFHVSPFFPIEGHYKFRFQFEENSSRVDINYHGPDGKLLLATSVAGEMSWLSDESFFSVFSRYGWMTSMVVVRIHLQALKLWIRKSRFYPKPPLPVKEVSS